jgi:hypothetical protein
VILAQENKKLCMENQRQNQKQQYCRRYIAHGGVLQAQQGQFLDKRGETALEMVFKIRKLLYNSEHYQLAVAAVFKVIRLINVQMPKECIVRIIFIIYMVVADLSCDNM